MQPKMKIVVAVLVVALIAVVGLIVVTKNNSASEPAPAAAATPEATMELEPEATAEPAQGEEAAQDTMYEGALAGLTEEEIAQMALAEEESSERQNETGAEDAVD